MKITYNWIKKYIDLDVKAEELASKLTMSGSEVGAFEKSGDDIVMELEITANRPDCLNMIGMAREASAVLDKDLILPDFSVAEDGIGSPDVVCEIVEKDLCTRYTARVINDVEVKSLPEELKKYILAVGIREVNNIVDITNYCLMETGQPMHAFDLDKISGEKIFIRKAKKGEKIVTIDDVERQLKENMLVIADETGPIAVAGVMGGKNTEVTAQTRNILLESAYFDPGSVRKTARDLGLTSDSSYRFERGVDKGMIKKASDRASSLISLYAGGKINKFCDEGQVGVEQPVIDLDIKKTGLILGVSLEQEKVTRILERLGMEIQAEGKQVISVKIPSYRQDVTREIDLVEEVGRVYGYENIPERVEKIIPQIIRKEHARKVREKTCDILSGYGLNEIMTYSLISDKAVEMFPEFNKKVVKLWNALSEEHKVLTPQILSGMLNAVLWNINRNNKDLGLFETAKVYNALPEGGYKETSVVSLGLTGNLRKNWQEGTREASFFDLKGVIENFMRKLKMKPIFIRKDMTGFLNCAEIKLEEGSKGAGFIGQAAPGLLRNFNIDQKVFLAQIDLDKISEKAILETRYTPIPKFPFSSRDISVICGKNMNIGDIERAVLSCTEQKVRAVEIVSIYEGDPVPEDKRSVSFSVQYGDPSGTLNDKEIEKAHSVICKLISEKYNIEFR